MAGYPGEMEKLLESNPGLKSRFPYIFHFEDYTADELMEIASGVAQKNGYSFSTAAIKALKALITKEVRHKDRHFSNGRFVTQLINAKIIPAMSSRLATLPESKLKNKNTLQTIQAQDIPITEDELKNAMKRSQQGLLFVDGDAPAFKSPQSHFDSEKLRFRLTSLTADLPGNYALIIAEHEAIRQPLVNSLKQCGIAEFDHTLHFEDYTANELLQILEQMLKKRRLKMERKAKVIIAIPLTVKFCAFREKK